MKINKDNYEAFFLDYHEGNLSSAQVDELMLFLNAHPELKEQLDDFEAILVPEVALSFEGKTYLKKQPLITSENYTDFFIGHVEQILNDEEEIQLEAFLKANPGYISDFNLFKKTKLVADTDIVFKHKSALKHINKRKPALYYWSAAAASIVIVISFYFINSHTDAPISAPLVAVTGLPNQKTADTAKSIAPQDKSVRPPAAIVMQEQRNSNSARANKPVNINPVTISQAYAQQLAVVTPLPIIVITPDLKNSRENKIAATALNLLPPPDLASAAAQPHTTAAYLSLSEFAIKKINDKYRDEDNEDGLLASATKVNGVAAVTGKLIEVITGKKTVIQAQRNSKGEVIAYQFTAGNFEFSRSVSGRSIDK